MAPIHQQIAARSSAFFYCIGPYALTLTIGITMVVGVGAMFNMKDEGTSTATRATNAGIGARGGKVRGTVRERTEWRRAHRHRERARMHRRETAHSATARMPKT